MDVVKCVCLMGCLGLLGCSPDKSLEAKHQAGICQLNGARHATVRLDLNGVYLFGDYQHGVSAVDESCPGKIINARIAKEEDGDSEDRLQSLRNALYFAPKIKSGVFKVYGEATVDEDGNAIFIREIYRFQEVDNAEMKRIFALTTAAQK